MIVTTDTAVPASVLRDVLGGPDFFDARAVSL
jgi:hypothetical protein